MVKNSNEFFPQKSKKVMVTGFNGHLYSWASTWMVWFVAKPMALDPNFQHLNGDRGVETNQQQLFGIYPRDMKKCKHLFPSVDFPRNFIQRSGWTLAD